MAGQVRGGEGHAARTDLKAGDMVSNDATVNVSEGPRWVSRGAHKLVAAPAPSGSIGWPRRARRRRLHRRLHRRAAPPRRRHVYALDVGQASSPGGSATMHACRIERVNARHLGASVPPDLGRSRDVDVSFISLRSSSGRRSARARQAGPSSRSSSRSSKPGAPKWARAASCGTPRSTAGHRRGGGDRRGLGLEPLTVIDSPLPGPEGAASSSSTSRPGRRAPS